MYRGTWKKLKPHTREKSTTWKFKVDTSKYFTSKLFMPAIRICDSMFQNVNLQDRLGSWAVTAAACRAPNDLWVGLQHPVTDSPMERQRPARLVFCKIKLLFLEKLVALKSAQVEEHLQFLSVVATCFCDITFLSYNTAWWETQSTSLFDYTLVL